jgi:hypothetical protein
VASTAKSRERLLMRDKVSAEPSPVSDAIIDAWRGVIGRHRYRRKVVISIEEKKGSLRKTERNGCGVRHALVYASLTLHCIEIGHRKDE